MTDITLVEKNKRKMILEGNLLKIILILAIPIALTNIVFNLLPSQIDTLTAISKQKTNKITDILPILTSIKQIFFYFGVCLAIASTVVIGREYGKGNYSKVYILIKNTLKMVIFASCFLAFLGIFFKSIILSYITHNETLGSDMKEISGYYYCLMFSGILMSINSVFLGLLRIKGNIRIIYFSNFLFLIFKIGFNYLFIFLKDTDLAMFHLGLSTIFAMTISNLLLLFKLMILFKIDKNNKKLIDLETKDSVREQLSYLKKIFKIFYPIFLSKFIYELGKLIILLIIGRPDFYAPGSLTTISVADFIAGFGLQFGFSLEESSILIISANLGNKNILRSLKCIYLSIIINFVFGLIYTFFAFFYGVSLLSFFNNFIFSNHSSRNYMQNAAQLNFFVLFSCISGFFTVVVQGILLKSFVAFKKPNLDMYFNFCRILIRIPLILLFRRTDISNCLLVVPPLGWNSSENGWKGYGFINFFSNLILLFFIIYLFFKFVKKLKKTDINNN
ncbi:Na+-driven multidrug efflux pump [Candidatus Phytoplasma mali]|uniref:Na+-driven multidrug efflux pump n=1 Tax=Phytoplasma mali (strain AT) TaxID=482235 RepID=B3R0D0_PHYMT|nr:MATE family efflux transporter [Candidatus Phytoplasma mali]CAP18294.1 Na+-driven multidrug efflux pump [Candidatus Phytoplasma mali]